MICYEDNYCIIANKPNDVLVHHAYHSRNKSDEDSLLQLLEKLHLTKLFPVHRLDRKTSGIIILTKNKKYVSAFQELFHNNQIQKVYFGLVRGFAPKEVKIDSPVKGRDAKVHKEALTYLKLINKINLPIAVKPYDSSRYSLVELEPKTGRMHQLRVHMNKISHPLIGDPKYGDKNHNIMYEKEFGCTNLFLHAGMLKFKHPFTNQELSLKASFPKNWTLIFNEFNWKDPIE